MGGDVKVEIVPEVLLVDDDKVLLEMLQDLLISSDFAVDTARDAAEGYRMLRAKRYDVVFIDIVLPSTSGIEFLKEVGVVQPETPAILFTGKPSVKTAAEALRIGAFDYLSKPVERTVLLNTAKRAVETKRLRQEKKRLKEENRTYQKSLEALVEERTHRIRRQKEFLENILESLSHPFYVVDVNDYTIRIANSAANFGGITNKSTCYELIHGRADPCDSREHYCIIQEIKKNCKSATVEHLHHDANGKASIVEVHGYPIFGEKGGLTQVIFYSLDISERKRLESIAAAKNLMDNIGYIFSGIRHEIGNPINSLKTCLSILEKQMDSLSTEKIRELVRDAAAENTRVEYLLNSLKNFSFFEHPQIEKVDLVEFMQMFQPLIKEDLDKKAIALEMETPSEPCFGWIDSRALHHVLLNLLANAVDAIERANYPRLALRLRKGFRFIQIEFSDNGHGMSEQEQADLFKPFYTTKPKGTGLGLVMVNKMLSEMNCLIQITSREGLGTTVTISIPEA